MVLLKYWRRLLRSEESDGDGSVAATEGVDAIEMLTLSTV